MMSRTINHDKAKFERRRRIYRAFLIYLCFAKFSHLSEYFLCNSVFLISLFLISPQASALRFPDLIFHTWLADIYVIVIHNALKLTGCGHLNV